MKILTKENDEADNNIFFFNHLDGSDEDLAVDAVVDSDGVAPVEEVDVRVVAVLDLELLTAYCTRLSASFSIDQPEVTEFVNGSRTLVPLMTLVPRTLDLPGHKFPRTLGCASCCSS